MIAGNMETPSAGGHGHRDRRSDDDLAKQRGARGCGRGPDSPVELGVKFYSEVGGAIKGIRFYKSSANTGTHVGNLWSSDGRVEASATFTNETLQGWQQANFATPVPIDIVYHLCGLLPQQLRPLQR